MLMMAKYAEISPHIYELKLEKPINKNTSFTIDSEIIKEEKYLKHEPGAYGHVVLKIEPYSKPKIIFENAVNSDTLPEEYIHSVIEGIYLYLQKFYREEKTLTGIKITLINGSYHPIDSDITRKITPHAIAAIIAVKEALSELNSIEYKYSQ